MLSLAQDWAALPINITSAPTVNAPQIKKEEFKDYRVEGNTAYLQLHTITEYNINGRVVQYTEYTADSGGNPALSTLKIIKYDRGGNRIGVMRYNSNNALIWSEEYIFDQNGRKSKVVQTSYGEIVTLSQVTQYQYDSKGNITTISTYNSDNELVGEYKRNYNALGEIASTTTWSYISTGAEAKPIKRTTHTTHDYDVKGNLKLSETEVTEGKTKWKDVRYFENNFVVEWLSYKNGEMQTHYKKDNNRPINIEDEQYEVPPPIPYQELPLEYDDRKRNPLQHISHNSLRTVTVKNNALGNPIKEVVREQQQVVTVTYFYYDEENKLIRQKKIYKLEDRIDETLFEYNEFANPLKEITLKNGEKVSERIFGYEYYP